MRADDELCLCFHVTWRKVINYIRIHRIRIPSQLAECQSAGTGCGWCRNSMRKLVTLLDQHPVDADRLDEWLQQEFPAAARYGEARRRYIAEGLGKPPQGSEPTD